MIAVTNKSKLTIIVLYGIKSKLNIESIRNSIINYINNSHLSEAHYDIEFLFFIITTTHKSKTTILVDHDSDVKHYNEFSEQIVKLKTTYLQQCLDSVHNKKVKECLYKHFTEIDVMQKSLNSKMLVVNVLNPKIAITKIQSDLSLISLPTFKDITITIKTEPIVFILGETKIPPNFLRIFNHRLLYNLTLETLTNIIGNNIAENKEVTASSILDSTEVTSDTKENDNHNANPINET